MHPLNSRNFGNHPGAIAVEYNNGNAVVSGYILKQPSFTKWVCTTDGVEKFTCELTEVTNTATLAPGQFTILAYPYPITQDANSNVTSAVEHVGRIDMNHVSTAEGNRYIWTTGEPTANGMCQLGHI